MIHIGIVGSRRRRDRGLIESTVSRLAKVCVVSGGCPNSVDTWAVDAAKARGLTTVVFHPKRVPASVTGIKRYWMLTKANYARNKQIAAYVKAGDPGSKLLAFVAPDRRGGTENTIKHCRALGVPVEIL